MINVAKSIFYVLPVLKKAESFLIITSAVLLLCCKDIKYFFYDKICYFWNTFHTLELLGKRLNRIGAFLVCNDKLIAALIIELFFFVESFWPCQFFIGCTSFFFDWKVLNVTVAVATGYTRAFRTPTQSIFTCDGSNTCEQPERVNVTLQHPYCRGFNYMFYSILL